MRDYLTSLYANDAKRSTPCLSGMQGSRTYPSAEARRILETMFKLFAVSTTELQPELDALDLAWGCWLIRLA
jgi:hypothetical protein